MKIKVFESGNYPQGNFDTARVKNIFSNIKDTVKGIFIHSSKWKNENKMPLDVGYFNNFELKDNGDKVEVFANVNFNDKGLKYYNDGILKGVSVEIKDNILDKIAVLPIGTNPAIAGAEFEESVILNFEEVKEMNREDVLKTITLDEVKNLKLKGYVIEVKEFEEIKPKTEEEIRKEILAEFEEKEKMSNEVKEFMEINSKKITPAMKKTLTENVLKELFKSSNVLEFENKKIEVKEIIKNLFNSIPDLINTNGKEIEFNKVDKKEKTIAEIMQEAKTKTENLYK